MRKPVRRETLRFRRPSLAKRPEEMGGARPIHGRLRPRERADHDDRLAACRAVVDRYDDDFQLSLTEADKRDLTVFLKSLDEGTVRPPGCVSGS